ncbi:lbl [Drosophila busckii]|uniref:Lbl n=1 Tax=Drosophila busckii TaxID=30019 RepID=A0A0M4F272_DROBS|nr:lbl [Drosophila busckii]
MPQRSTLSPVGASRSCSSPAVSEISVGSPSPPPPRANLKRLRLLRSPTNAAPAERIKSFSIDDILGRNDKRKTATPAPPSLLLHERLQAAPPAAVLPQATAPAMPLLHAGLHPFLPPALLHSYEQRLAWDYQRQLQEHFQAQLLRQMNMDPAIIPIASEDGSSELSSSSNCSTPKREPEDKAAAQACTKPAAGAAPDTPLDALFQLSTKNFDEEQDAAALNIFATRSNPKKKRKSRTAFTNQQIFELEKRFLYQKYLSPADRDEIAAGLGLSNAQMHGNQQQQSSSSRDKDKQELRMLKMMTLMRYSDGKLLYPPPPQAAHASLELGNVNGN